MARFTVDLPKGHLILPGFNADLALSPDGSYLAFTHFADGTAHKNRMQGNDFVQSLMYRRGVTCFSCHNVHGTPHNADLLKPARDLCLTYHSPLSVESRVGAVT